jgi:regulator of RNase E activity RraA
MAWPAGAALADRLLVGPSRLLHTPSEAAKRARPGDVILIDPGHYTDCAVWSVDRLTIIGQTGPEGGSGADVVITGPTCRDMGLFVTAGHDITVRNITLGRNPRHRWQPGG